MSLHWSADQTAQMWANKANQAKQDQAAQKRVNQGQFGSMGANLT